MKTPKLIIALLSITLLANAQYNKTLDFTGINGQAPSGSLIFDGTYLYGMTGGGGVNNNVSACWDVLGGCGIVFKIKPDGTDFTKLLDFDGTLTGANPQGSLYFDGTFLYGTTQRGGTNGNGTIFKIKSDGTGFIKIFDFNGINGSSPYGSLISDSVFLYGMTSFGGTNDKGAIFKIKPDGTNYSILHNCDSINGIYPGGDLVLHGTFLYGMMGQGGSNNTGVIFKIKPDGTGYSKVLDFTGANGKSPHYNSFILDSIYLYGMTSSGGQNDMGVIFKIKPDGTEYSKLLDFTGVTNGNNPAGSLVSDGMFLYGTTCIGGLNNKGVMFKIKPDGTSFSKLLDFEGQTNGSNPFSGALVFNSISFYGMTSSGGSYNYGTVFSYNTTTSTVIAPDNEELKINIYPNPFVNNTTLIFPTEQKNVRIRIIDLLGKEIESITFSGKQLIFEKGIIKAGVYFVQISKENKNIVNKKIIVQ